MIKKRELVPASFLYPKNCILTGKLRVFAESSARKKAQTNWLVLFFVPHKAKILENLQNQCKDSSAEYIGSVPSYLSPDQQTFHSRYSIRTLKSLLNNSLLTSPFRFVLYFPWIIYLPQYHSIKPFIEHFLLERAGAAIHSLELKLMRVFVNKKEQFYMGLKL
ncbi:hypothetical protein CVD28_20980 [Bacillus sp. M6-12]|nr:hypothetical protein CVD28_20980 [Bacillus sp. M6-12]